MADPLAAVPVTTDVVVPIGPAAKQYPTAASRVLVIGNNLLIAQALVSALAQRGYESRSANPASGAHLEDLVGWRPHVALMEVDPGDMSAGVEVIGVLRRAGVAVAVMSGDIESRLLDECLEAGASAVIDTRSPLTDLITVFGRLTGDTTATVESIATIESKRWATSLQGRAKAARLAPFAVLTAREKCVLAELMEGHRAESIAKTSWVSISTVRSQIKAILQKLGVNSQLAAVAMARDAGWNNDIVQPAGNLELA
jgi:two-component system, NarL family, nitrate/nitrite response regulator NarL